VQLNIAVSQSLMNNKSLSETEPHYNSSSLMKEVEEALAQAREGKYTCRLRSYSISHSRLEIMMWDGEWGHGKHSLRGRSCIYQAPTQWDESKLRVDKNENPDECRFILRDESNNVESIVTPLT
jgi:hypothetical protein